MSHIFILGLVLSSVLYSASLFSQDDHGHKEDTHEEVGKTDTHDDHDDEKGHDEEDDHAHDDGKEHDEEDDHGDDNEQEEHDGHGDEESENNVHLSDAQQQAAGIVVSTLTAQNIDSEISVPGEIRLNSYATSQVTPRIEAQVLQRNAKMGDHVSKGQSLVSLSSVSVAETQGELLIAGKEWQRVRKLGRKVVSEKRYLEAKIAYQQAQAKLVAYGLTQAQIKKLLNQSDISQANGRFELLATQNGTVINDDFVLGQMVDAGDVLFEITNESRLWVEALVKPQYMSLINIGAPARIKADDVWLDGKVIQVHHELDEVTRTLAIRLEIDNPDDNLHPGQFVTANIQSDDSSQQALVLPQDAVMRSADGDWQVFVEEEPGEYEPREIEIVRKFSGQVVIEGLKPGVRVVTSGAFFVQSEFAKSGFAVHNH